MPADTIAPGLRADLNVVDFDRLRVRLPEVVYWGARLPDAEDLATVHSAHAIDVTGGMLDENPDLSLCPEATRTFPGQPG